VFTQNIKKTIILGLLLTSSIFAIYTSTAGLDLHTLYTAHSPNINPAAIGRQKAHTIMVDYSLTYGKLLKKDGSPNNLKLGFISARNTLGPVSFALQMDTTYIPAIYNNTRFNLLACLNIKNRFSIGINFFPDFYKIGEAMIKDNIFNISAGVSYLLKERFTFSAAYLQYDKNGRVLSISSSAEFNKKLLLHTGYRLLMRSKTADNSLKTDHIPFLKGEYSFAETFALSGTFTPDNINLSFTLGHKIRFSYRLRIWLAAMHEFGNSHLISLTYRPGTPFTKISSGYKQKKKQGSTEKVKGKNLLD